tara:strand:- start:337 stop:1176 length:840 start_codon:yes stop_codon:yes gene_type:complete
MQETISVGNVDIVALLDLIPPARATEDFFPDVPSSAWEPYKDEVLEKGNLQLYYGCFLARSNGKNVLVDTGIGPGPHPSRDNKKGNLINDLKRVGVDPSDVDIVVHSHLHIDHVGWNLDLTSDPPKPYFPNARYLVPRVDWDHFRKPENLINAPWVSENVIPLQSLSLMDLFEDGDSITDEITAMITPGHTPGHMVFLLDSAGAKGAITGDAIHSKVQIQEPSWSAGVDVDKSASERSRLEIIRRAVSGDLIIAAGHFHPDEHFGRIRQEGDKAKWVVA